MHRSRKRWVAVMALIGVTAGGSVLALLNRTRFQDRVYRVGWANNPPFQEAAENGQPTGFAVELLREAARRRGIRVQFVERPGGDPETELSQHRVDLWPLVVITPARIRIIHITAPYFETAVVYVVRNDGHLKRPEDLAAATISYADLPINYRLVRSDYPGAHLIPRTVRTQVLDDVCQKVADAAFMDEHAAITAILRGNVCPNQPLRLITTQNQRPVEGIGASFETAAVADALREEIGAIATEGKLGVILSEGSFFSGRAPQTVEVLLNAKRRERWLTLGIVSVSGLLILSLWLIVGLRRERNKATRAEQARGESEERLRTILDTAPDSLYICDLSGRILEVNPASCSLVGYSRKEILQRSMLDLVPSRFRERASARLKSVTGETHTFEANQLRKDGTELDVELKMRRLIFEGRPALVVMIRDITERKRAEEERARLEEQLRQAQKLETVGRLAGGVAHDFNNLLTVINGYSRLLLDRLEAGDPSRDPLAQIHTAGERAAGLTQQLLAFSRKQVARPAQLDLNVVIGNTEQMLRRLVGEDVSVAVHLSACPAYVIADSGHIVQVLMNLAANARDAMPQGGVLTVSVAEADLDKPELIHSDEAPAGSYVVLTVADNGAGMGDETKRHLFEPFYTTKGTGKGTGLGLATVYGIVRQAHGFIDVASEPGRGAAFRIFLPRMNRKALPELPKRTKFRNGAPETILVVEDQEQVRELAVTVLRESGYHVLEAGSGEAALSLAAAHPGRIDLLLTDVVMTGINGRKLAGKLLQRRPDLRVLYTSGYARETFDGMERDGIDGAYLSKPYAPDTLAAKIREVLSS